jgi:hypothetical protein
LENQAPWPPTQYIGQALAQHLEGVEKIVILGTCSSMWDVFGLDMAGDDETAFAAVADLNLEEAVRREAVT